MQWPGESEAEEGEMVVVAKVGGCSIRVLQVHSPRKVATLTQSCGLIRCPSLTIIDINVDILALWMLSGPYAVLRTSVVGCGGGDTGARCSLTRRIKVETPNCLVSLACNDPEVLPQHYLLRVDRPSGLEVATIISSM